MGYRYSIGSAIRYGFPVGRVRVLEGHLLSNATLERLLDAPDFEAQKRVLSDTEYGNRMGSAQTAADVEAAFDEHVEELHTFLETSRLPDVAVRYFRLRYDFGNMKARLKAEALEAPIEEMLEPHGTLPVAMFAGPLELLPERFREIDAAVRSQGDVIDRLLIDPVVDAAMYEELLATADEVGSRLLREIAILTVDLANLKAILRARSLGWSADAAAAGLVAGGSLPREHLLLGYQLPYEDFAERLATKAHLPGLSAEGLLAVERLDVVADNLLMRHAKRARLMASGIEPVIGYVFARSSEMVILRTLLVGKIAGLSAAALRSRMRELYV